MIVISGSGSLDCALAARKGQWRPMGSPRTSRRRERVMKLSNVMRVETRVIPSIVAGCRKGLDSGRGSEDVARR
jgi:hypothetical protein